MLAKEGVVLVTDECRVLVRLITAGEGADGHEGLQLMARGAQGEGMGDGDGVGSAELWALVDRVVAQVLRLLSQWPGMQVDQFVQWLNSKGKMCERLASELEQTRQTGKRSIMCSAAAYAYGDDGGRRDEEMETITLDRLMGPRKQEQATAEVGKEAGERAAAVTAGG